MVVPAGLGDVRVSGRAWRTWLGKALQNWKISVKALLKRLQKLMIITKRLSTLIGSFFAIIISENGDYNKQKYSRLNN